MIGDPSAFKAEHADTEPKLVFFKPLSAQTAISNALLTLRDGQMISLQLLSAPSETGQADFLVDLLNQATHAPGERKGTFLIPETRTLDPEQINSPRTTRQTDAASSKAQFGPK